MELMDGILSDENLKLAIKAVKSNKGAAGIDKMTVGALDEYFAENGETVKRSILNKQYRPQPVRRVYIPKSNGKMRPLGIPTVVDRVVQQAVSQILVKEYEPHFSEYSYGFRPDRDCHMAIRKVLEYLNDGCEWIVDFDIEKYFDTVNHDKLISTLREHVNDDKTLHLIRSFLNAGVMEDGMASLTTEGVPQGGPLSPILSNIYLDKLDRELEARGLHFVRYADDFDIFVKSEMAADRVMKSVTSWLERKLFLKVSVTKTKVVRPSQSSFLGFTFWKSTEGWKPKPASDRKQKLCQKVKEILKRKHAVAIPLSVTFTKLNRILRGWINYFRIGSMKGFLDEFGQWLRHKVRVIIVKQWKKPMTIYRNLQKLNKLLKCNFSDEDIYRVANSRLGWYRQCGMNIVNYALSPQVLARANEKEGRPGLVDPLAYYLSGVQ
jgi:group II intron reverse transcriptase/maturase